ncbi:hypothetical protein ACVRXQ_04795 [Streptococcus panodentis]|uniref:Lipase n=1 Tax=Streptococcus panodentis TaxID=1581472 RepID=A0ABS5AWJ4_9STRE|nr:hypothetical protein [Streptococcus panodentis]MBP2620941.1 hypothetical protein [Streptococcus panodentis]
MAVTHQDIQYLQKNTKDFSTDSSQKKIVNTDTGQKFQIIDRVEGVTQAIAAAPLDANGEPILSQTIVTVAGTQPVFANPISSDHWASTSNAIGGAYGDGMTAQHEDIEAFYQRVQKITEVDDKKLNQPVRIYAMSGFSQSATPVVKVAADHNVPMVVNYTDWGAQAALDKGNFTASDLAYINRHVTTYDANTKDTTIMDSSGGRIPYANIISREGTQGLHSPTEDHNPAKFYIIGNRLDTEKYAKEGEFVSGMTPEQVRLAAKVKASRYPKGDQHNEAYFIHEYYETFPPKIGNMLDLDWYAKKGEFFVGMTEKQVRKAAKIKAEQSPIWNKHDEEYYVKEYKKIYGDFVPEAGYKRLLTINRAIETISSAQSRISSLSGSQLIYLRKDLVTAVADLAEQQGAEFEAQISQKLNEYKQNIEERVSALQAIVYSTRIYLSDGEVESLLSQFTLETCWDSGIEEATLSEAASYKQKLDTFGFNIRQAAERLEEVDRQGSLQFRSK